MRLVDIDLLPKGVIGGGEFLDGVKYVYEMLKILPTVDAVDVQRGDWELVQGDVYRCSVCHRATIDDKNGCWALTRYCHNCGACMSWKGGSNDEVR